MNNKIKFLLFALIAIVIFYFFSVRSLIFYFKYYRALYYGVVVQGQLTEKNCHWETSTEYPPAEFCDIYYTYKFGNTVYNKKNNFIESKKCKNINEGIVSILFMESHPDESFIMGFYEYSLFWTIVKFIISIIALPFSLIFLISVYLK